MNSVLHGVAVYAFLWLIFRISGKRTLSETTTFDFVLLLIISECVQNALVDSDNSFTHAALLVITLLGIDIIMSKVTSRSKIWESVMNSRPTLILENGRPIEQQLRRARMCVDDILSAARESQGLERLDQIKYAVLEQHGGISIVPKDKGV